MRLAIKLSVGILVFVVGFVVFALLWPMTASRFVYPIVEAVAINDFIGVTTDGNIEQDLFHIESTGVSTQPVLDAANAFLDSLTPEQRARTLFPIDDREWQRWANIHLATRQGVGFLEFTDVQAEAAFQLIDSGLSARGYKNARDIMRLEGHLADLVDNHVEYGEKRYWITIMGHPSATMPWGWQLDGHHLAINFFVLRDQVVMTPTFMGSEPTYADSGLYAGTRVFDREMAAGLALMSSLTHSQRTQAIVNHDKTGNNAVGQLFQDNVVVPYEGLILSTLSNAQRDIAIELIRLYTGQIRPGHAEIRLTEVLRYWDTTYFSWVGGTDAESVFYYRIHSPVVIIEFDHQKPVALDMSNGPVRDHVHTVVRTPNGNDYGKDLLRQHLDQIPH